MSELPENLTNGENIFNGTTEFYSIDDAGDPKSGGVYAHRAKAMSATMLAQYRDLMVYLLQDGVGIGNALYIDGKEIDTTGLDDNFLLKYNSSTQHWEVSGDIGAREFFQLVTDAGVPSEVAEGMFWWDNESHTIAVKPDIADTVISLGFEDVNRVYNDTGVQINNGTPVYETGSVTGMSPNVDKSDASSEGDDYDKRHCVGLMTHDIGDGEEGIATNRGLVRDVDTSSWAVGTELWLSETAGELTDTKPLFPSSQIRIGRVLVQDATNGIIDVHIEDRSWLGSTQTSNDASERTGFILVDGQPIDSAGTPILYTFDEGTRTFTLGSTSGTFYFYSMDNQFKKSGNQTKVWGDVEGNHYIYFDEDGAIQETDTFDYRMIEGKWVFITAFYWDATNGEIILDEGVVETHGCQMDGATHYRLHNTLGAQIDGTGFNLADFTIGNGSSNSHAQWSIQSGILADEDLRHSVSTVDSTTGTRILGLEGATGVTRQYSKAGYHVILDTDVTTKAGTSTGRPVYNYNDGSAWVYDAVPSNDYVVVWQFVIGTASGGKQIYNRIGNQTYNNITDVEDNINIEAGEIIDGLPFNEKRLIGAVALQCGAYTNAVKARVVPFSDGSNYKDFRKSTVSGSGGITVNEHNNLSNRDLYTAHPAKAIQYLPASTLTISAGSVTYSQPTHIIASESGTSDDLTTISVSTTDNYRLKIWADSGDTITIKHGTGNIITPSGNDYTLSGNSIVELVFNGTNWVLIADSGSVSYVTAPSSSSDTGTVGQIAYDSNYMYFCVGTDTWVRTASESSF